MKRAKAKRAKAAKPKAPSDADLIRECMIYEQSIAAYRAAFRIDPDGNSDTAAKLGARFQNRAVEALTKVAGTPAATAQGLYCKAGLVATVLEDDEGGTSDVAIDFFQSLSDDMTTFLQPIVDGRVVLDLPAIITAPQHGQGRLTSRA